MPTPSPVSTHGQSSSILTVDPRPRPPPLPPGVQTRSFERVMGTNPSLSEQVLKSVMSVCTEVDQSSRLVSMTRSGGQIFLRVRAGDVHSVTSLQRALSAAMPLSQCSVAESWVDGTLEADIVVLSAEQEYRLARKLVTDRRVFQYSIAIASVCILVGLGEWLAALRLAMAPPVPRDEL